MSWQESAYSEEELWRIVYSFPSLKTREPFPETGAPFLASEPRAHHAA